MAADYHRKAEELMALADIAGARGRPREAARLYAEAAQYESDALAGIPEERIKTRGILAVSAIALLRRAGRIEDALYECAKYLSQPNFSPEVRTQLFQLFDDLREISMGNPSGVSTSDTVDWVLRGPKVAVGSAPSDVVVALLDNITKYGVRMVEYLAGVPLRVKGRADEGITAAFALRVTQPAAGSFRFSTRFVTGPVQLPLFDEPVSLDVSRLDSLFASVLDSASEADADAVKTLVPDNGYQETFMRLVRLMAPDGKKVSEVQVLERGEPVARLTPGVRRAIDQALRPTALSLVRETERFGVLRALDLDKRTIELTEPDGTRARSRASPEAIVLEDIIGPLVNRPVRLYGDWKNNAFIFTHIEDADDQDTGGQ